MGDRAGGPESSVTAVPPRTRRLRREAEQLRAAFAGHPFIRVTPVGWDPPEEYRVEYWLRGVVLSEGSRRPGFASYFVVSIKLPFEFPRVKPLCAMQSPAFHPNIGPAVGDEICIADYWTPSQSVTDIVIKIGQMLQYQDYNLKSPLNAVAARWADSTVDVLPVGDQSVAALTST